MSDDSRNDDVLELTDNMTVSKDADSPSSTGSSNPPAVPKRPSTVDEVFGTGPTGPVRDDEEHDDEVLELGEHQMVSADVEPTATASSIPASPISSPPAVASLSTASQQTRPSGKEIPMARISLFPPPSSKSSAPPAAPEQQESSEEAAFELQEDHVVADGKSVDSGQNEPVEHAFDFGSPAMVFDNAEPSNAGIVPEVESESGVNRDDNTQEQVFQRSSSAASQSTHGDTDAQPKYAVPFNESEEVQESVPGSQEYVSFIGDAAPAATSAIVDESASDDAVSVDVAEEAGAISDSVEIPDDVDSVGEEAEPATDGGEDGYVSFLDPSTSESTEGSSSSTPAPPPAESDSEGAPVQEEVGEDLDIDITDEVEEVVENVAGGPVKPPPPPDGASGRPVNSFFKNDKIDAANASLKIQAKTNRRSRGKKREWWASIFDDEYLMLLPERSPYEQQKQIDFIQRYLGLPPGALLLDLACGNGRNSIGMAQRNYRIVGVDLSLSMLARAGDAAQDAGQKINFIHGDMRDLGFDKTFDGVFSLDTSFGYFDEPTNMKVLKGIYRALKPGGTFLLELANRDFVIKQQPNMVWFQMDNMVCMEETDFNYINNRLYISRQLIIGDNEKQSKHEFSLRLYSLHEIGQLLHQAGFAVVKVSGHRATPGAFFGPESSKLIIIAERRGE